MNENSNRQRRGPLTIKEGPQKTAVPPSEDTETALATPGVQRESPGLRSVHCG
jgi:hypothetical protein